MSTLRDIDFFKNLEFDLNFEEKYSHLIFKEPDSILFEGDITITSLLDLTDEYRNLFKSSYIRWALAINGLNVANEKYNNPNFTNAFAIKTNRIVNDELKTVNMAVWNGANAAKKHLNTIPMLTSYGIIDIYSLLEELILKLFKTYRLYNPSKYITGKENKHLRVLYRNSHSSEEDKLIWENEWNKKLDNWVRKKIYDGLDKVFISFIKEIEILSNLDNLSKEFVNLKEIDEISKSIKFFSVLRNSLIHGSTTVTQELFDASKLPSINDIKCKVGDRLEFNIETLSAFDQFIHALLGKLNVYLLFIKEQT